jgi:Ribbon-helix-helix domain
VRREIVADTIKVKIFHLSVEQAKAANATRSAAEIDAAIAEALAWARGQQCWSPDGCAT